MGEENVKPLFGNAPSPVKVTPKGAECDVSNETTNTYYNQVNPLFTRTPPLFGNSSPNKPEVKPAPLLQGKIRKRIDVTIDDLRKYGDTLSILEVSKQQILQTNVDELCLKYVLDWGSHIQQKHSQLLDVVMEMSNTEVMKNTKNRIGFIVGKLNDLDLTKLNKKTWFKSKEDKLEEMSNKLLEIKQESTGFNVDSLLKGHSLTMDLKKQLVDLQNEVDPYIVTCSFFSEYEKDQFPKELYITRLSSLLATKASIGNDLKTVEFIADLWIKIVELVNSIIRNELPIWCSNFASVLTGAASDLEALQVNKNNIINKLTKVTS